MSYTKKHGVKVKPKFNPHKYLAICCGSVIQSSYPGEFVSCDCGKAFVDENEYYVRGNEFIQLIEEKELFGEDKDD